MIRDIKQTEKIVDLLLQSKSININVDNPFTFTSGRKSPVYVDIRNLISYPEIRKEILNFSFEYLTTNGILSQCDVVCGGETAGIPFAAWISHMANLPMSYVRKQPKGFGKNKLIEGADVRNKKVLLVEDLITDGGSKSGFINSIRQNGGSVEHLFVIFHYDTFPEAIEMLELGGIKLHSLATWWNVLEYLKKQEIYSKNLLLEIENFLRFPEKWSTDRGGK